jgi:hydroxymethylglutaryl-CoA lyase
VSTEDLAFLCQEMGIDTGIDLDALIACAELAENIVGHPLPGSVKQGGNLARLREAAREGARA